MAMITPHPRFPLYPFLFGLTIGVSLTNIFSLLLKPSPQKHNIYLKMFTNLLSLQPNYIPLPSILLNYVPEQSNRWINLGYWEEGGDDKSYDDACTAMVNLVKAKLTKVKHDYIIDVGCGNGDSLKHWSKPSIGINITPLEVTLANKNGTCILGDATDPKCFLEIFNTHPNKTPVICAIDCAYHFNPRSSFYSNCKNFGFEVVLTDVILKDGHSWLNRKFIEFACRIAGIPKDNVKTKDEYVSELKGMGYHVEVQTVEGK
ncbi:hypothetical protein TrLO_g5667 [Triparma laevis f. longispina]|uniref:Uncharacterized protein n=1 Tax=Triparma laevis f. longispina TaxID=1714387 RepID=A0A9W7CDP1_9STRA|nr:hypothetical protein TrLO_g5667 [Triparma laevis f. longispina]